MGYDYHEMREFITWVSFAASVLSVSWAGAACSGKREIEHREFVTLKTQLVRISRTPTEKLGVEIARLEDLEIGTKRIAECRDACLVAYESILEAQQRSGEAEAIIASLSGGAEEPDGGTSDDSMERMQAAAALLERSEKDLDAARVAKDDCHEKLGKLEAEGLERER